MERNQLHQEHSQCISPQNGDAGSFVLFFVSSIAIMIVGTYIITMLWAWWAVVFVAVVVILAFTMNNISVTTAHAAFFNNSENHTHDDECITCGELYGPKTANTPDHIQQAAHVCRHSTGKMDYPR